MPASDGLGFLVILNKSSELRFEAGRSELIFRTWTRPVQFVDCGVPTRVGWVSELRADIGRTVSIERLCLSLSSCRKPKLKEGNKSFVPEPRRSSVFCVFRIPMRMNIIWTLWTFYEHMYISRIRTMAILHDLHSRYYVHFRFGFVLRHIDHCRPFNAKCFLCIYQIYDF